MPDLWYAKSIAATLEILESGEQGLSRDKAKKRLLRYGPNKLPTAKVDSLAVIFLRQFRSPLIYILLVAALVMFLIDASIDALVVLAVLLLNAIVGTIQEGKARNTLIALEKFVKTSATVLRDGRELVVPDEEVVPGDIVFLQEGEKVPADARLITANYLSVDEAAFTGESAPVNKTSATVRAKESKPALQPAEQKNMVFKGTHVVAGHGKAVATSTGLDTVIGKISRRVAAIDTDIPLKQDIQRLARTILIATFVIVTLIFFAGIYFDQSAREMFATAVALSVSVIPEGLPVVLTLVLATGVWKMSRRHVLVKRLQAVEALGQASVIAVDKTGTITKNELSIERVYVNGRFYDVAGSGYEPRGQISIEGRNVHPLERPELALAGRVAALCANARASFREEDKTWHVSGDPTEAALLAFSQKVGFKKDELEEASPLIYEVPFNYKTKYHLTVHKTGDKDFLTVVGAPENVLRLSKKIWQEGRAIPLTKTKRRELDLLFEKMSEDGLRVLGFSILEGQLRTPVPEETLARLTFVGFYGMEDTLRPSVRQAVEEVTTAGIRVVMITGDYKLTAKSIAKEAGIYREGDLVVTGEELGALPIEELTKMLPKISIFARVAPEDKLRIIEAYRGRGDVVAMTGDGVNDAPSLVAADLGVAMGKIGTEVTKEASDLVLLDDRFANIVAAAEEGRSIYRTIKKVVLYLFSTSIGEVLTISGALFIGYPLPILPTQIIWLNFVTDGFLTVALAMEPQEKNLLRKRFRKPTGYLVDSFMAQRMFIMAVPMALGTLLLFTYWDGGFAADLAKALTISLTSLAVFQWFNAWNCRSESKSVFRMNPASNKFLLGATAAVIGLQLLAIYHPLMQKLLHTTPLAVTDWLLILPVAATIILAEEVRKFFYRRRQNLRAA